MEIKITFKGNSGVEFRKKCPVNIFDFYLFKLFLEAPGRRRVSSAGGALRGGGLARPLSGQGQAQGTAEEGVLLARLSPQGLQGRKAGHVHKVPRVERQQV